MDLVSLGYLKKMPKGIRSKYDALTGEINDEEFFNENIDQNLIQLYVDSITSTWFGWQETLINLLDSKFFYDALIG